MFLVGMTLKTTPANMEQCLRMADLGTVFQMADLGTVFKSRVATDHKLIPGYRVGICQTGTLLDPAGLQTYI